MNDGLPWVRVLLMLGLLTAMFGFPVLVLTLEGRRAQRRAALGGETADTATE